MKLDYGTQLSPYPISLSIGTLRKPKLKEIAEITFDRFNFFEVFLKITPEFYYTKIKIDENEYWKSLPDDKKQHITIYEIIKTDEKLREVFLDVFNFFFVENVFYSEDCFWLLPEKVTKLSEVKNQDDIRGIISENIFGEVLDILQQICCIAKKDTEEEKPKFKNKLAEKIYKKMQNAAQKAQRETDTNYTLPNIISALSNKHPSVNPINVWELTIFQLLDSFNRLQINSMFEIDSTRVSVWGDEKKTFDAALWYKNEYDKK